jgi:hyperosmotically inducible periplasmic protein
MSRRGLANTAVTAGVLLALGAAPAAAQQGSTAADRDRQATGATSADDKARAATSSTGEKITDAWILTKVKAQFVGEDALENSDINVDVRNNVVILKGTVVSQAGKERAVALARATEGVARVQDNLRVGVTAKRVTDSDSTVAGGADEAADDVGEAGKEAARKTKQATKDAAAETSAEAREAREDARESARDAQDDAKDTVGNVGRETREATGTAGQAVNDGWITTKVKSSFVGVDALEGSDIDVDTKGHVVTLRGTVASAAARARAVSLAKQVEGVKSVKDELTIAAKK